MPLSEEAMRRAGALVVLAAVSALVLVLFPAPAAVDRTNAVTVPTLFVALLLGSAAVLLSPAHRAVAHLARRVAEAARPRGLQWVGFTGIALYTAYVVGDARKEPAAAAVSTSVDQVNGFISFLVFLAGVWTLNMSVLTVTGRGSPPPAAAEEELDGGEVDAMIP